MTPRAFAHASALAPDLTARFAMRSFLTPPRPPIRPDHARVLAAASRRSIRAGGRALPGYVWGDGPTVLLVHGWGGRAAQLGGLVAPLVGAGLSVLAFDAPAHGASPGARTHVGEMAAAVAAVLERERVHAVIAHSAGAIAAARALAQHAPRLPLAAIAPAVRVRDFAVAFARAAGLSAPSRAAFLGRLETDTGTPWSALDLGALALRLEGPAWLALDPTDRVVPIAEARALAASWRRATVAERPAGGHYRAPSDPTVIAEAAAFVREHTFHARLSRPFGLREPALARFVDEVRL
ncbi:MAG: alpha/beta fold hydrolase [Sandaracinaceae bacterium]|nr:alpha/beta fold hydrolase [Sandaracinaceae bacterium]